MKPLIRTRSMQLMTMACLTGLALPSFAEDITLDQARAVLKVALAHADSVQAPGGAIAIVDRTGSVVILERRDGTFPAAAEVSIGKARTAAMFRKATRDFETTVNEGRTTMVTVATITAFTPLQGGVPLFDGKTVIGAIGVSGATSAAQDDQIAEAGASSLTQQHR